MKKILKFFAYGIGLLLVLALGLYGFAWYKTEQGLNKRYSVQDVPLVLKNDAETLAYGARQFIAKGCADCHGQHGEGRVVFDVAMVGKVVGPNITAGGTGKNLAADDIARAMRHAVGVDGRPLVFMPSGDYKELSDDDTAAIVAHIKTLAVSNNEPGAMEIRPMGRVLYALGKMPLFPAEVIDHSPRQRIAPVAAASVEYGKYLAQTCTGCHGSNFAGKRIEGTPPEFPPAANLTQAALKNWSQNDFKTALRTGKRPDGSTLNTLMPWPAMSKMNDQEIEALWMYLSQLPPVENKPE